MIFFFFVIRNENRNLLLNWTFLVILICITKKTFLYIYSTYKSVAMDEKKTKKKVYLFLGKMMSKGCEQQKKNGVE